MQVILDFAFAFRLAGRAPNGSKSALALIGLHVCLDECAGVLAVLFQECSELVGR